MSQEVPLSRARVVSSVADGDLYQRVVLGRASAADHEALVSAYQRPGQYLLVTHDPAIEPNFFAMARAPRRSAEGLELLIKGEGEVALAVSALGPGQPLWTSAPLGQGFALERARGCDVVFLAAGSGIAPVLAALESMVEERDQYGRMNLYYGQSQAGHFAYRERLRELSRRELDVALVDSSLGYANTPRRWVHLAAERDLSWDAPHRLAAVVCGMTPMEDAARRILRARGVADERILLNR